MRRLIFVLLGVAALVSFGTSKAFGNQEWVRVSVSGLYLEAKVGNFPLRQEYGHGGEINVTDKQIDAEAVLHVNRGIESFTILFPVKNMRQLAVYELIKEKYQRASQETRTFEFEVKYSNKNATNTLESFRTLDPIKLPGRSW